MTTLPAATAESLAPVSWGSEALCLTFDTATGRFIFTSGYDGRHVPKDAGFSWSKEESLWWSGDPFVAMKLIHYADPPCRARLVKYWTGAMERFQQSQLGDGSTVAVPSELTVPAPTGLAYMPYQMVGIEFLIRDDDRCGNTLLADEMGLGKTIQIIGAMNHWADALNAEKLRSALIITPASLKLNWAREIRKWLVAPLSYGVAQPKHFPRHCDIVICNYDLLDKWRDPIHSRQWDLIVADEAHYLKNPDTLRSKMFYAIPAKRKILATGTPIVNRPRELFPLVSYLDPKMFPSFFSFACRYCDAKKLGKTWDFTGSSNLEELQAKLRSTIMVRRLKSEVLKDLPPKTRNVIELPVPRGAMDLLKKELAAYEEKEPMLNALRTAIQEAKQANDTAAYQQAVAQFRQTSAQILGDVSTIRKEVALKKAPMVASYLEELWAGDPERKIVLWCHHHVVMDEFMRQFTTFNTKPNGLTIAAYAVKFSGNETLQQRDEAVQRFQNDPRCLLFVGQIQAGGVGITLTASNHCIFAELDWVPGNLSQAEDRLHRIGQKDNVLVEHLVLEGSLDCRIAAKVVEKQLNIDKAMNTPTGHLQQHSHFAGTS